MSESTPAKSMSESTPAKSMSESTPAKSMSESTPTMSEKPLRLNHWGLTVVLSILFLSSTLRYYAPEDRHVDLRFAIATSSISTILGFLFTGAIKASECSGRPNFFTRGKIELICSGFSFFLWCIAVALLERNDVTFDDNHNITDPNLYYFSWGAFFASMVLFFHNSGGFFNPNKADVGEGTRFVIWTFLLTVNIILAICVAPKEVGFFSGCLHCKRLFYGFALGLSTSAVSFCFLVAYHFDMNPNKYCQLELFLSLCIAIGFCGGVLVITEDGPGSKVGNVYYATWSGFLFSLGLFIECLRDIDVDRIKRRLGLGKSDPQDKPVDTPDKEWHEEPDVEAQIVDETKEDKEKEDNCDDCDKEEKCEPDECENEKCEFKMLPDSVLVTKEKSSEDSKTDENVEPTIAAIPAEKKNDKDEPAMEIIKEDNEVDEDEVVVDEPAAIEVEKEDEVVVDEPAAIEVEKEDEADYFLKDSSLYSSVHMHIFKKDPQET